MEPLYSHCLGIVHRDVKPANVMLDAQDQPLLMDFGLAHLESSQDKLTQDGTLLGTPAYLAPELVDRALGAFGPAADQYSLGIVLYELLCGETPFCGPPAVVIFNTVNSVPESPRRRNPAVPRDLETICLKAIARRPEERYADCGQLADDLRRWLADEPIRARRMGLWERAGKWARRNPLPAAMLALTVALALVSTAAAARLFSSSRTLARAVENVQQRKRAVQEARETAETQTRLAREAGAAAEEKRGLAEQALAKLQAEIGARNQAEAQREEEAQRRSRLTADVAQQQATLAANQTRLDAAEKMARQAAEERQRARAASLAVKWNDVDSASAEADTQLHDHHADAARELLAACPATSRGWEWSYLNALANGLQPGESRHKLPLHARIVISPNAHWLAVLDGEPGDGILGPGVYALPEGKRTGDLPPRLECDHALLSPDGKTLALCYNAGKALRWKLLNVETGKTTTIPVANTPFGEPCFTPDGASLVYRQLRAKQRDARVAALLVFALDKGKAFRIQGGETSHYETGYSGIEFSTHGCLLTTESWNDEGRLTSSGWWEYPAPSRERTVFNRRDVPDRVILEWYESLYKAGRKGHYVAGSTDGSRVLYGDSAAARVLLDSAEEKDNRWRGRDHVWHFATAEMEGILGMNSEGSRLARLGPDRRIRLWDVDRAKEAPLLQTLGWCNVPFAPDSKEDPRPVIACDWTAVAAVTSAAGNRALYCWTLLQRVDSPERPKCRLSIGAVAIRGGVVWQVPPSTPAAAGLQVGDKIYALEHDERNRDTVHSDADLARALENCVPGHTVTLRIDRDKKEIQLEVTPIVIDASPAGQ